MPPSASLGMFGVDSVHGPREPNGPMEIGPIVKLRLFHLSISQFTADRNASLIPSHMPRAAERIRPGRPFTKSTILRNRSTIQSRTSLTQPRTRSKTPFHRLNVALIRSHNHLAMSATIRKYRLTTLFHHQTMMSATTWKATLMASHAGLMAFSHNQVAAAPTARNTA